MSRERDPYLAPFESPAEENREQEEGIQEIYDRMFKQYVEDSVNYWREHGGDEAFQTYLKEQNAANDAEHAQYHTEETYRQDPSMALFSAIHNKKNGLSKDQVKTLANLWLSHSETIREEVSKKLKESGA